MGTQFLTEEQFNERKSRQEGIVPWREVPTHYYIESVEEIQTSKGEATTIVLLDKEGERIKAFATSILARALDGYVSGYYIKSLGLKESKNGKSYYNYELVQEHDWKQS